MARILYAVMGNTHGHVMRSLALAGRMAEHEFYFVGGGRLPEAVSGRYPCLEVPVLRTVHKKQKVDVAAVIGQAAARLVEIPEVCGRINALVDAWSPDLVLVDREFFTPIACRYFRRGKKTPRVVALNHSGLLLSTRYPVPGGQRLSWFLAMLNDRLLYDHTVENCSVSFYHPPLKFRNRDRLLPPVVREEVLRVEASEGGHVLVYQTSPTFGPLIETLRGLRREVVIYGFRNENRDDGNLHFRAYSPEGILKDLASCAYAVVNGGHNLISEALHYRKPVLCFPIALLFEQFLNAYYIRKLGYGDFCLSLKPDLGVFERFEAQLEAYRAKVREFPGEGTSRVVEVVRSLIAEESQRERAAPLRLAYVPMKYPVLSQTFIQRDVRGLVEAGLEVTVMPVLRHGTPDGRMRLERMRYFHPGELARLPFCLLRELLRDPGLVFEASSAWLRCPKQTWEQVFHTLWGAAFACLRAEEVRRERYDWLHAAWASAPATAVMALSRLTRIPYSFGAHAYDLYRDGGDPLLGEKLKTAAFVHTTTRAAEKHLCGVLGAEPDRVLLVRRGMVEIPPWRAPRETPPPAWKILSVGRLVPKKGHVYQVEACRRLLEQKVPFQLIWVGQGPLRAELERLVEQAGLQGHVRWCGALEERETQQLYQEADFFWHTGIADASGDRDGLPNVIPEAMFHGVPVISTDTPGPNEAVSHEATGLLVKPADGEALASAVLRLAGDAPLRQRLSVQARAWAEEHFNARQNARVVAGRVRRELAALP